MKDALGREVKSMAELKAKDIYKPTEARREVLRRLIRERREAINLYRRWLAEGTMNCEYELQIEMETLKAYEAELLKYYGERV